MAESQHELTQIDGIRRLDLRDNDVIVARDPNVANAIVVAAQVAGIKGVMAVVGDPNDIAVVRAPASTVFTCDEVVALDIYQHSNRMHPFTCQNRGDGAHRVVDGDKGILVPTVRGWICRFCNYTQNWAHDYMKRVPEETSADGIKKGEAIFCANGHVVAEALEDLNIGDWPWHGKIGNWKVGAAPHPGDPQPRCPVCDAEIFGVGGPKHGKMP